MNVQIELNDLKRIIDKDFKLYGSDEDLKAIRDAIDEALTKGLVMGWVGIGSSLKDDKYVFPNNGKPDIPTKNWEEVL